ncbi:MAG TPA: hypothetical protein VIK74_09655 [Parasegetibacter sp.]
MRGIKARLTVLLTAVIGFFAARFGSSEAKLRYADKVKNDVEELRRKALPGIGEFEVMLDDYELEAFHN